MIKCGKCGSRHDSVAQVKSCYAGRRTATEAQYSSSYDQEQWDRELDSTRPRNLNDMRELYLRSQRAATTAVAALPTVSAGHYALDVDGTIKFYRVNVGRERTRWAGFIFLDAQAGDDYWPIKNRETKISILKQIAANPREAMARYGRELGVCARCGRTLTDEESRTVGIGPVCRDKI